MAVLQLARSAPMRQGQAISAAVIGDDEQARFPAMGVKFGAAFISVRDRVPLGYGSLHSLLAAKRFGAADRATVK
jgi:hypothetical protein